MKQVKNGVLICNVCEEAWKDHTVGGNCIKPPVKK